MNRFKKYTDGQLSEQELESFSEDLINSTLDKEKKKAWEAKLASTYDVHRRPSTKPPPSSLKWLWISIGIALLLALGAYFWFKPAPKPPLPEQINLQIAALDIMSDQTIIRRGEVKEMPIRIAANEAYANKDYEKAAQNWEAIDKRIRTKEDCFYLGLSYLLQENPNITDAIKNLTRSKKMNGPIEEINWALSLAYLKENKTIEAKRILLEIINTQAYKHQQAKELLEQLQ